MVFDDRLKQLKERLLLLLYYYFAAAAGYTLVSEIKTKLTLTVSAPDRKLIHKPMYAPY